MDATVSRAPVGSDKPKGEARQATSGPPCSLSATKTLRIRTRCGCTALVRHRGYISAEAAPATSRRAPMATYSRKAQAGKGMRRKGTSGYSTFGFIGGGLIGSRIVRGTLGLCRRPPNRLCQRHIRVPGFGVLDDGLSGPGGGGRGVRCRREGGSGAALTPRRSPALTGQAPRRTGVGVPFGAQDAAVPTSRVPSVEGG